MTTAYAYDCFHREHTFPGHPENHERLERTWQLLQEDGILEQLLRVPVAPAPMDAVLAVHEEAYVQSLEAVCERGGGRLDPDTYATAQSCQAARLAAGGVLAVTEAVMQGAADNGFALVRPPGHHARPRRAMGFCLLGNVAIAARWLQHNFGVERVLIADFDVHHGNGAQEMFYDDGSVLFFSVHQYPFYPGTGSLEEVGAGPGEGRTVNVPFPAGVGDEGFVAAFREVLRPLAEAFQPQVVLVSAGFDAHWMDPLAGCRVGISGFAAITQELLHLADAHSQGRLICTLEGGYNLDVLPHCILSVLRILSGDPRGVSDPFGGVEGQPQLAQQTLDAVKRRFGIG